MEKFLGVLFCGGRGTRLGEITKYISKSFVPVYDKPVFKYGLNLLENSKYIDEIIILTNNDNDEKLKQTGYKTIIQDDNFVFDMFSGWEFVKKVTKTKKNGVLVPSDNILEIQIDYLIKHFLETKSDLTFSLIKIKDKNKLKDMGSYDPCKKKFYYKTKFTKNKYGVVAPYIIRNEINTSIGDSIFNKVKTSYLFYKNYWFDIGDYKSFIKANIFFMKKYGNRRK